MPRYRSVSCRKRLSPYHRKKREEARRKTESQKECSTTSDTAGQTNHNILEKIRKVGPQHQHEEREEAKKKRDLKKQWKTVKNRKGSSASDIAGHPNDDMLERVRANCANCASHFESHSERNVKFKTMLSQTNEIEIIDAIFYIYGLTVADWAKTLTLSHELDFTSVSEVVFSNGIPFCSKCTSALENVYSSHKSLKELEHNESLFAKALNNKYGCEIQNKSECDDNNELNKSLNNSDLTDEELEFKEEDDSPDTFNIFDLEDATLDVNSELDQLEDPLMLDGLDDLQSSNNTSYDVSKETSESTILTPNENNVSLPYYVQRNTNGRIPKILQRHRHPINAKRSIKNFKLSTASKPNEAMELSWPKHEISDLKKNICRSRVPQKQRCSVRVRKVQDHSFNISCCDESFFCRREFVNHQLNSHKEEMPKLIKCNICEVLIPKNRLANHMQKYNEFRKRYFECKICTSKFICASGMTGHLQTHDSVKYTALICDICETPMQSDYQLIVHKMRNHFESEMPDESKHVYTCNICNQQIKGIWGLKVHCDRHNPTKPVTCDVCGKLFPSKKNLHMHMKRMHLDTLDYKYPCSKCNGMFGSEPSLAAHQTKNKDCHFPNHRLVCQKCGKSVLTNHMSAHMRVHEDLECSDKELFRCPQCGKLLKHRDSLQKHKRREHPVKEKLFFCEKCGKTTKNMTNMRIHMKIHEKD